MPDLESIYDQDEEQARLAAILDARYLRMGAAVLELVASTFTDVPLDQFRLDDAFTRRLLEHSAEQVVRIDDTTKTALREALQDGQRLGLSNWEIATRIDHLFTETWSGRAQTVARTELAEAQVVSALDRYAATGMVEAVKIVENTDTDEPCARRNGQVVPIESRPRLLHPQCLPGNQLVFAPDVIGASVRQFEGEVVTLRTAADDLLTCTPNHPILTNRGWVASRSITEGGYVFRSRTSKGISLTDALHDDDVPTRIEKIARALTMASSGAALTVPGAAPQFHGDGRPNRDVHVVRADRMAKGSTQVTALKEPVLKQHVKRADAVPELLSGYRARKLFLVGDGAPAGGGVRRFSKGKAILSREATHAQPVAFADGAGWKALPQEQPTHVAGVYAEDAADLLQRLAGLIEEVRVVDVSVRSFTGHVYNLETERGWYVAQGIVTHNCRMALVPVITGED